MIWTFEAFELDDGAYVLRRAGEVIPLRRKVFEVLRYLVAHGGTLITKEELLASLWPNERIVEDVIPQNVAAARRALGDSRAAGKIIQTVHGKGYRFIASVRVHDPQAAARPAAVLSMPALVGREHVLAELNAKLQSAIYGQGQVVIVQGEPGMGKTRLVHELTQRAREHAAFAVVARCQDTAGAPPFRPWLEVLRQLVAASTVRLDDVRPEVARLWQGQEPSSSPRDTAPDDPRAAAEARFRLFQGVTELLALACESRPLAIVLDDLHWADTASLQLFAFIARELQTLPLLLMGTARPLPQPELATLLTETHVRRIALTGLTETQTAELAALGLGRALAPERVREVAAFTEGNPFFVLELMRLVTDATDATGRADDEQLQAELPRHMRDVILLRVRRLGPNVERVLLLAAVMGNEIRLPILEQLAELERTELLEALTTACDARLLRDFKAFSHALIQESLYESLPVTQRAALHQRIGCALETALGVDAESSVDELAYHFRRAAPGGDMARAVMYCRRAAEQAFAQLAFDQAVSHYRAALELLLLHWPIDEEQRYELKLGLGAALFRADQDGTPALEAAAAIARNLARPELLARVVLALEGWPRRLRRGRTDNPALYPLLTEALASPILLTQQSAGMRAQLSCALALNAPADTTSLRQQITLSRNALELARRSQKPDVLRAALVARLRLMGGPDELRERLDLARELSALAERSRQPERIFEARELCIQPFIALGKLARADRAILECAQIARRLALPRFSLQVLRFRLQRALGNGCFDEVQRLTQEAVALRGPAPASPNYMVSLYAWQSFERAWRGDGVFIERQIAALLPKVEQSPLLRAHIAALCAAFGRPAAAQRCYRPLLDPGVLEERSDEDWLLCLIWTAQAVVACADRSAAPALYARLAPYAALNVTHVEWLVYFGACARWLGSLAALMGDHVAADTHFQDALVLNAGWGARPALALSYLEYARLCVRVPGRRDQARALLARAYELALELDMQGVLSELAGLQVGLGEALPAGL